jgi:teichoic acid transport system permease protein
LVQPGSHGSVRVYLRRLWERREYAWHVPRSDLRSQQMNTVLGNAWHLLNPILSIAVYYVIFGLVLQTDRGVTNFIAFLAVGVFVFQFTQKSTTSGSNSIVRRSRPSSPRRWPSCRCWR